MPTDDDPLGYKSVGSAADNTGFSAYDWMKGFGASAIESVPEMIGYTPSTFTQQFRQNYPVSGFLSELAGTAVPYTGWLKGIKYIPKLAKAAEFAGELVNNPIGSGALKTATELAPFELGRAAISQTPGLQHVPELWGGEEATMRPFTEMLGDASLNLAVGAGIGGLFHGLAAAGTKTKGATDIFPDVSIHMPYPLQARMMQDVIDKGTFATDPDMQSDAMRFLVKTREKARKEELTSFERYVAPIAHDALPGAETDKLQNIFNNTLFKVPKELDYDKGTIHVRKFDVGGETKDFGDVEGWQNIAKLANLPPNFEQEGQYFRYVSFNEAAGEVAANNSAVRVHNTLTYNMSKIDDKAFMTREADDGMFVVAKKILGNVKQGDSADSWVLFKTDQPGKFFPEDQRWTNAQVAMTSWTPGANAAADGGEIYNTMTKGMKEYPLTAVKDFYQPPAGIGKGVGYVGKLYEDFVERLLPQNVVGVKDNQLIKEYGGLLREYFFPRQYQFNKTPRGNWMSGLQKLTYDAGTHIVNELMNGQVKVDTARSLFWQRFKYDPSQSTLGFNPIRLLPDEMKDPKRFETLFNAIIRARLDPAQIHEMEKIGKMSRDEATWFLNLHDASTWMENQFNKAEAATGAHKVTEFIPNSYGWDRKWEGDTRIVIADASNKPVAVASGLSRKQTRANATAILKQNPTWNEVGEYSLTSLKDESGKLPKGVSDVIGKADWQLDRMGIRGFVGDTKAPTAKEFMQQLEDSLNDKAKKQATMTTDDALSPSRDKLAAEDPTAFRMFEARSNDYKGVQGSFSKWQNNLVDKLLAPVMGVNSASKLVQLTNTTLFNWQLGAMRIAYPVVNALQFVQSVNPEIAFMLTAPPEALRPDYVHFATGGTRGPNGSIAVLDPFKILYKSFQEMRNPSPEMYDIYQQASNERVIEPRIVENYIGKSATELTDIRKLFTGKASEFNFFEWLRATSEFLPAFSERISRTHALTVGYIMARDYMEKAGQKLTRDEMYTLARQFTEKTMYGYTAADKPRVFTTPAGSLMGLFKNWMFNYLGQMGQYTDQAFMHNNWAPLIWQTAGTAALGGAAATPMMFAANQASKWFTNKSAMEQAYEQLGAGGDAVMYGLPAAITGISLYSNVNTPLSNPTRDAASLFSIAAWDRASQIGKLAGAAFDNWQTTGKHPGQNKEVLQLLMRTFAPASIYRTMGAFATPGQITQIGTGRPLISNMTPVGQMLYAMGFNPLELDRGLMISEELYSKKERMKGMVAKLGQAWADAEGNGDSGEMATILRQGMVWGVDTGSVIKSGMKRLGSMKKDIVERQLTPKNMYSIQSALKRQRGQEE